MKFLDFLDGNEDCHIEPDAETKSFGPWVGVKTSRGNEVFSQKNLGRYIMEHVKDPSKGVTIPEDRLFRNDEGFTLIRMSDSGNKAAKEFLG